jgi:hypothetical protein
VLGYSRGDDFKEKSMSFERWTGGREWNVASMGKKPTTQNFEDAIKCGVRPYTLDGLALAMTFRTEGSTRSQRVAATGGQRDNKGSLGDARRAMFGTGTRYEVGKEYRIVINGQTIEMRLLSGAGHWCARICSDSESQNANRTVEAKASGPEIQYDSVPVVINLPRSTLESLLSLQEGINVAVVKAVDVYCAR